MLRLPMQAASLSTRTAAGSTRGSSDSPLGTRIGQYEIIRLLGRGGMGEVYLARDLRLGRLVAIKVLIAQHANVEERFLAEATATARCHHENIVVIYQIGAHQGRPYMVLEYLEGQTLREWLRDHATKIDAPARIPVARTLELMLPVVRALACAHDHGIVHRDLKPENVVLTRAGVVKVLDFGVAKLLPTGRNLEPVAGGSRFTSTSSPAGTRAYMSPEQVRGDAIDHRADIWAVGVMLFELAVGEHPLQAAVPPTARIADHSTVMPSAHERLPELGPLAQVIDRCLIRDPAHRTANAHVLVAELEAVAEYRRTMPAVDGNPFAGLAAFQEADAGRFFGRDRDIEQVVTELRSRPLVAVVGPSGAGKSSLVRAGVIPALKRSGEGWDAHIVRPGREPLAALAGILTLRATSAESAAGAAVGDRVDGSALAQLRIQPGYLGAQLRAHAASNRRRTIVFVDQLEELYTLGASVEQRFAFLACLTALADDASSPLRVLVSMRSDFLDRLADDRRFAAEVARGLVLLPPMDRDGMREALLRPVAASEHRFENAALLDRMVDAVVGTPGALPLLQFTAARLWERRDRERRLLPEASYEELGGVAGALAMHADVVLAGLSADRQLLVRAVLERLVTPERTRVLATMSELRALQQDPGLVEDIVQHLIAMRLVVIEPDAEGRDHTVELVHESLIERWPTLLRWLDDNQHDATMLARLRAAARDWERNDHAAGLLWTGDVARAARAWQQRYPGALTQAEQRYLAAMLALADRGARRRRRGIRIIVSAAMATALAMAWLAWKQTQARREAIALAHAEADEAMQSRDATRMAAIRALPDDPTMQLALLREIEDLHAPPPGAVQEARRLLHERVARVVLTSPRVITCAAFSPDGQRIVSSSDEGTVEVWNADGTGQPLILRGHNDSVSSVAFSPDGRRIVSGSSDNTVRVWNADGTGEPLVLRGHDRSVSSVAFSPGGERIASASHDGTVRLWNADGIGEPLILRGHDRPVLSMTFSPDGARVASASMDKTVRVRNADGTGEPLVLRGHEDSVSAVAFSPDGRRIASGSSDKSWRLWNANGGVPSVLRTHDGIVMSVAFSPDAERVAVSFGDGLVEVWNADGSGDPLVLRGHKERAWVAFSPDGQRILSVSIDRTIRMWSAVRDDGIVVLRGHENIVDSVAFSPDGRYIASASYDRTVRVWSADGRGSPVVLRGHDEAVQSVAFSPDGWRLASGAYDSTVRVWNANGSSRPLVLRGHDHEVDSVAFSPDGQRIVSASHDRTMRVWNANGSGQPLVLRGHERNVNSAVFSPDGRRIVSASWDKTARVWNADGSGEVVVLRGHDRALRSAVFSPDGQRIVTASLDHTVRIWNADGHGEPVILRGHTGWVFWAEFSPDGRHIVSASRDATIRVWPADGAGEPIVLVGHDLAVIQARFSPDGRRIVSASRDETVRIWREFGPITLDDPRLWTATSYCMPIERRIELLGVSHGQAQRDRERCLERVGSHRVRHAVREVPASVIDARGVEAAASTHRR